MHTPAPKTDTSTNTNFGIVGLVSVAAFLHQNPRFLLLEMNC